MAQQDPIQIEFELIVAEVKKGKKETGRPSNLTPETYKAFLYYYLQTGMKEWSALKSQLGKNAYETMRTHSQTFQGVLKRDGEDLKAVAMMNLSRSIRGIPAAYDEKGNKISEGILGDVDDSKYFLNNIAKPSDGEVETTDGIFGVNPPKTQEEADFLLELFKKTYDYVESKRNTDK